MNWLSKLNKAEYFFRPSQLVHRVFYSGDVKRTVVQMPWGAKLKVNPTEDIGRALNVLGVYELPLSECLWRSLAHVQGFIDVGSNIGYFSAMAASRPGFEGLVYSFEPHPILFEKLQENLSGFNNIKLFNTAASSSAGEAELEVPVNFEGNMGIASLERKNNPGSKLVKVKTQTLDEIFLNTNMTYSIMIDTEGHEASVLAGAQQLLKSDLLKFVFFEEFGDIQKAESAKLLRHFDYQIFKIKRGFLAPILIDSGQYDLGSAYSWEPCNYLAIKNQNLSHLKLFKQKGWSCL